MNVREAPVDSGLSLSFDFTERTFSDVINPLARFDQIGSSKFDQVRFGRLLAKLW